MKKGVTKDVARELLFRKKASGVPKGVKKTAYKDVRSTYQEATELSDDVLNRKLGDQGTVNAWNVLVNSEFEEVWQAETDKAAEEKAAKEKASKEKAAKKRATKAAKGKAAKGNKGKALAVEEEGTTSDADDIGESSKASKGRAAQIEDLRVGCYDIGESSKSIKGKGRAVQIEDLREGEDYFGESSLSMSNEESSAVDPEDGDDSDDDAGDIDISNVTTGKRDLRTCTATLKQILRPDLLEDSHYERILGLLEKAQRNITIAMEELSVLTRKAVHVVSIYIALEGIRSI